MGGCIVSPSLWGPSSSPTPPLESAADQEILPSYLRHGTTGNIQAGTDPNCLAVPISPFFPGRQRGAGRSEIPGGTLSIVWESGWHGPSLPEMQYEDALLRSSAQQPSPDTNSMLPSLAPRAQPDSDDSALRALAGAGLPSFLRMLVHGVSWCRHSHGLLEWE